MTLSKPCQRRMSNGSKQGDQLQLEYRTLTDKMNQLYEMHKELVQLRDAFYRYAKFITPEKEQVNNVN